VHPTRKIISQGSLLVAIGAMFLTWSTEGVGRVGTDTGEGQFVALVALVTMLLVQIGWRPAWMGTGVIVATLGRQLLLLGSDAGVGLYLGVVSAVVAGAVLIAEMFAGIERPAAE